jgi:hypothetical protein
MTRQLPINRVFQNRHPALISLAADAEKPFFDCFVE